MTLDIVYRFGLFELDPIRETLHGPEGPVLLRGHAFRVLMLLVERAPEVVSRDDILDEVWGHQALSESSIAQVIRDIRSALNDSARAPVFVVTRYGRGYQFVGEFTRETQPQKPPFRAPKPDAQHAQQPQPLAVGSRRPLWVIAGLVALALGWQWLRDAPTIPKAEAQQTIALRAIAPAAGESLSSAFVDYIAFVLANSIGADRIDVTDADDEIDPARRVIEISLASLDNGDRRTLELAVGQAALDDPSLRLRFDEASELMSRSFDEILATLEQQISDEIALPSVLISDSSFAIESLLRGMAAQMAGDVGRAAELFEAALAEDPGFEFARYELAIALRRGEQYDRALAILEPMTERLQSNFWEHRLNNAIGIAYWRLQRYDEALDALRRAEAAAVSDEERAIVLSNIGLLERNMGRLEQAEATLLEATRLADRAGVLRLHASSRNSLASVLMRQQRTDEALVQLGLARDLFYETGNLAGYSAVLSRTAKIHDARGERAETESLLRLALGIREQIGDRGGLADIQIRLSRIHRLRGEFAQARELARSALDHVRGMGADDLVIDAYQALAALALADQRIDQARAFGNEGLRLAELTGRDEDRRAILLGLYELDFAEASTTPILEAALGVLIRDADAAGDRSSGVLARDLASRMHAAADRHDDARRMLDRAAELLNAQQLRFIHSIYSSRAELALERGELEHAERAIARLEQSNAPEYPRLLLKARLHAARGDLRSAVETAHLARSTIGDWWRPEDQTRLDDWAEKLRS